MRKSYLMIAAAATILASCANEKVLNDIQTNDKQTVIGFSTFSEKATKATNEDLETYHETFAVYSTKKSNVSNETSKVFDADIITYQAGVQDPNNWTYSPYRYWDKQAVYNFVAVAPNANVVVYNKPEDVADAAGDYVTVSAGYTLIGQNLQTSAAPQENELYVGFYGNDGQDTDLMTAAKNEQDGANHATDVNMIFKHILAKLNISIAKAKVLDDAVVLIKEVNVSGLDNHGTYVEKDYKLNDNNKQLSGWTSSKTATDYNLNWKNTAGIALNSGSTDATTNEYTPGAPLYFIESLVMPQSVEKDVTDAEKLYIEYEIITGTGNDAHHETYKYELPFRTDILTGTDPVEQTVFDEFMDRSNYTLKLTIQPTVITFDAEAVKWAPKTAVNETIE